ncbi:MAG: anhydro-N-acetylmuramic acid kinase, partial [Pseudomonadota bacterium]
MAVAKSETARDGAADGLEKPMRWALGMMSGTSLDGVDAAFLRGDGVEIDALGPSGFRPYTPEERAELRRALEAAAADPAPTSAQDPRFAAAADIVTAAHAELAEQMRAAAGAPEAAVVGFHGQTVLHRPAAGLTLQIGDAAALARRLGAPVAHGFRLADVAAGGQGAPLAPFAHLALARRARAALRERASSGPIAMLNLGGVGNLTWIAAEALEAEPGEAMADPAAPGALLAFDTGP